MDLQLIDKLSSDLQKVKERYHKLQWLKERAENEEVRFAYGIYSNNSNRPAWGNCDNLIASVEYDCRGRKERVDDEQVVTTGQFGDWFADFNDFFIEVINKNIDALEGEANVIINNLKK